MNDSPPSVRLQPEDGIAQREVARNRNVLTEITISGCVDHVGSAGVKFSSFGEEFSSLYSVE
jgi:hypothetical protein